MEVSGILGGGAPVVRKYQVAATIASLGVPHLVAAANAGGLAQASTTGAADMVGINLDTAVYTTTQGAGASSAERLVSFVVNSDAILRCRLCNGATDGTALAVRTVTSASSGGTAVTTGDDWSSPTVDEGAVFCYSGANIGMLRKVTSVGTTAATVTVPFDYGIVAGDQFIWAPYWPMQSIAVQLTTALYEANIGIAVGTGAAFLPIELKFGDVAHNGLTKSYVYMLAGDHFLNRLS